jgi:hypothetical protein
LLCFCCSLGALPVRYDDANLSIPGSGYEEEAGGAKDRGGCEEAVVKFMLDTVYIPRKRFNLEI